MAIIQIKFFQLAQNFPTYLLQLIDQLSYLWRSGLLSECTSAIDALNLLLFARPVDFSAGTLSRRDVRPTG